MMERLKRRRKELGYSYQDLANLTQMSKSTLQRYETGGIKKYSSQQAGCAIPGSRNLTGVAHGLG